MKKTHANITTLDHDSLLQLTNKPKAPFQLSTTQGEATCHEVLRFLPGRRLVVKATWNENTVVMKCFIGPKALRDYQREIVGIKGFQSAEIATPALLQCDADGGCYIVITQYLPFTTPFAEVWEKESCKKKKTQLIFDIVKLIAKLHQAGVQQDDVHLDNFIIEHDHIYAIDGGGVKVYKQPLSIQQAWENFALFFAVFYPKDDCYVPTAFSAYAKYMALTENHTPATLYREVLRKRKWRERFVKKCFRNCTDFQVIKSFWCFSSVAKKQNSIGVQNFLKDPDRFIAKSKYIKKGRTNTVVVGRLTDGRTVFIKKYKSTKGFFHSSLRTLVSSRARVAWFGAHLLKFLGIQTPEPIALLEKKIGPFTTSSYMVSDYLPGQNIMEYIQQQKIITQDANKLQTQWLKLTKKVELLLLVLQKSLIHHGDLKGNNLIVYEDKLYLVDLDSIQSFTKFRKFIRYNREDIKRFNKTWQTNKVAMEMFSPVINQLERNEKSLVKEIEL